MSARNMEDIAEFMKTLRFQKTLVGGVNERDVWRQLDRLQKEYRAAYECQEERYAALLREREEEIAGLREKIAGTSFTKANNLSGSEPVSEGNGLIMPEQPSGDSSLSPKGMPSGGAAHG